MMIILVYVWLISSGILIGTTMRIRDISQARRDGYVKGVNDEHNKRCHAPGDSPSKCHPKENK